MEPWTYLSSPINCQAASAEETPTCNEGSRDLSFGCRDARDLHNSCANNQCEQEETETQTLFWQMKGFAKKPRQELSYAGHASICRHGYYSSSSLQISYLTETTGRVCRAIWELSLARQNLGELRLEVQPFPSTLGEPPTSQFSSRILHALGIQPALRSQGRYCQDNTSDLLLVACVHCCLAYTSKLGKTLVKPSEFPSKPSARPAETESLGWIRGRKW